MRRSKQSMTIHEGSRSEEQSIQHATAPPDVRFDDVHGLAAQIDELRRSVVTPIQEGVELTLTAYLQGPATSGKHRLANATAGELGETFSYLSVDSYPDDSERYDAYVASVIDRARTQEPAVVVFRDFDQVHSEVYATIREKQQRTRKQSGTVVLLCEVGERDETDSPSLADLQVELPEFDVDRRSGLLTDRFTQLDRTSEFTLDCDAINFEEIAARLRWCRPAQYDWLVPRVKITASEAGTTKITQGLIERTIAEREAELKAKIQASNRQAAPVESVPHRGFDNVDGLEDQIDKLRRTVVNPLRKEAGRSPTTVYFDGPSRSGKTWLAKATAGELGSEFSFLQFDSYPSAQHELDECIQSVLERARKEQPAVVLFEDFDRVAALVEESIRTEINALQESDETVLVFFEPTQQDRYGFDLPPADVYIQLPAQDKDRHCALFRRGLGQLDEKKDFTVNFESIDFTHLVDQLERCRPADFDAVVSRAVSYAIDADSTQITQGRLERAIDEKKAEFEADPDHPLGANPDSCSAPFDSGSEEITEQFYTEDTSVSFDDVGGLDSVIERIRELMVYPQEYPELFEQSSLSRTNGLLLHGPPGNGKTLLARALATEMDRTFLSVRGPELKNKWFGESERRVRELFEVADDEAPSLIFFDEFDAVAPARSGCNSSPTTSVVNMLLTEMDGLAERGDVIFLAATNRRDALDQAVLRPGRIGETIELTRPDAEGRAEIFEIHMAGVPSTDEVTPEWFKDVSNDGLSGADIEATCRRAVHAALQDADEQPIITRDHVVEGLEGMFPEQGTL